MVEMLTPPVPVLVVALNKRMQIPTASRSNKMPWCGRTNSKSSGRRVSRRSKMHLIGVHILCTT